ncbi:MAG: YhfC family intramembrane metalloprotease [Lachnospiraceae bacterium]|nr:YhfC family intramembrane metalloprotease [Lachnospiraceae bacterium]
MNMKVPALSMLFMSFALLFSLAVPVLLFFWYRKRRGADILPFFIGCAVFFLFVMLLESLLNNLILVVLPVGAKIRDNIILYALYGGLMAGLFEESGRFVAMKTVLRRFHKKDQNALMYGAGHGGFEAVMILGMTSVNNLIYSALYNLGMSDKLLALVPENMQGDVLPQLELAFEQLRTIPSGQFLLGPVERIPAVIFHIALSVLVWQAARNKKKFLFFPLAILLHFLMDAGSVLTANTGVHVLVVEGFIMAAALLAAVFSFVIYRRNRTEEPAPEN